MSGMSGAAIFPSRSTIYKVVEGELPKLEKLLKG